MYIVSSYSPRTPQLFYIISSAMPSLNPFKRRKSVKATPAPASALEHPVEEEHGSVISGASLRPSGEMHSDTQISSSAQHEHPRQRMFMTPRRAPFGIHVKYKPPPDHAPSSNQMEVPERAPSSRDPREMIFSDEPVHYDSRQASLAAEPKKPSKSRGGFFGLFRRKSSKKTRFVDDVASDTGSREPTPVDARGSPLGGRNRLTRKKVRHNRKFSCWLCSYCCYSVVV